MPRAYSQSQGKFIDLPYDGGSTSPRPGSDMEAGGIDLNKLLLMSAAKNLDPDSASSYSVLSSLLEKSNPTPPKLTGKPANDVNFGRNVITSAQTAAKNFDPSYTGPIDARLRNIGASLNIPGSEKAVSFKTYLGDIRTAVRNYISGTAISSGEAKELERLLPNETDSDTKVKQKLQDIQSIFMGKIQNTLATAGIDKTAQDYLGTGVVTPPESENKSGGIMDFIKEITINPIQRSVGNIGTAAITGGQAGIANTVSLFAPRLAAQIASPNILGTQTQGEKIANNPGDALIQQGTDSLDLLLTALGVKGLGGGGKAVGAATNKAKNAVKGLGGIIRPVAKVGARETAQVAAKEAAEQTIKKTDLLNLFKEGVEGNTKISSSLRKKLLTDEYKDIAKVFPNEIPYSKIIDQYRRGEAYTKGQKALKSLIGQRNLHLRQAIESLIDPQFLQNTTDFAKGYGRQKLAGRVGNKAFDIAAAAAIFKLLSSVPGFSGNE